MSQALIFKAPAACGSVGLGNRNAYWTPELMAGIIANWNADTASFNTASPPQLTGWESRVGSGLLIPASGLLPTQEGIANTHPLVRFTSGRYCTVSGAGSFANGYPYIFAAMYINTLPTAASYIYQNSGAGANSTGMSLQANGNLRCYIGNITMNSPTSAFTTGLNILGVYYDASAGTYKLRVNGSTVTTIPTGTVNQVSYTLNGTVGAYQNATNALLDTALYSVVVGQGSFVTAANANGINSDITKIEGYLANKISPTAFLPNGHPFQSLLPQLLN